MPPPVGEEEILLLVHVDNGFNLLIVQSML